MKSHNMLKTAAGVTVCSLIGVCLLYVSLFITGLAIPALFISGLVWIYAAAKYNGGGLAASLCLFFVMYGATAVYFGVSLFNAIEGLVFYLTLLLPAIFFGVWAKVPVGFENKLLKTAFVSIVSSLLFILLLKHSGVLIPEILKESCDNAKEVLNSAVAAAGAENLSGAVTDVVDTVFLGISLYLPSIVIIFSIVGAYITVMAGVFVLRRTKTADIKYAKFNMLQVPRFICIISVIMSFVTILSDTSSTFGAVISNAVTVSEFLIGVSGFATVDYFLAKKIKRGYVRAIIYCGFLILGFGFSFMIIGVFPFIGFIESLWNIRYIDSIRGE